MSQPLLSVCITTYNHADYIRQALDSVLMQQTDFEFEILLGEDGSSDGTREICQQYADKFKDKIKLFLHDRKNVIYINGRPTGRFNFIHNLKQAKGKYIALLDGDDYWTDPLKLQKQVDFLEKNPTFSVSFHKTQKEVNGVVKTDYLNEHTKQITGFKDISEGNFIRTLSVVYRNPFEVPEILKTAAVADYLLHMMNASRGNMYYHNEVMGVYRIHAGGIWSSYKLMSMQEEWVNMLEQMFVYFSSQDLTALKLQYLQMCKALAVAYSDNNEIEKSNIFHQKSLIFANDPKVKMLEKQKEKKSLPGFGQKVKNLIKKLIKTGQ